MKQLLNKSITMTILLLSLLPVPSCREEVAKSTASCNCDNKQNAFAVSDLEGTVFFDAEAQRWGISVPGGGAMKEYILYDVVHLFFPCNLEEAYQVNNKKVAFSGNAYDFPGQIIAPAGYSFFCIEISSIGEPSSCEREETPQRELPWDYPSRPGMDDWAEWTRQFHSYEERVNALQIPDAILPGLSTADLTDLCLNYPYQFNAVVAFTNFHSGLDDLYARFNGIRELYTREEASEYILKYYSRDIHNLCLLKIDPYAGGFIIIFSPMLDELLLSRIEWHGEGDREEFTEILRRLVLGYETERNYESETTLVFDSNRFARAHIIFKMNPEALETLSEDIVKRLFHNGHLYNEEDIRAFDELSYQLIKE
ncbi:MAG: hypothetical protein LBJ72_06205 [Dysgonamonadaceae bacterium]|jgi:hypothetical protein|nr:hypothetical protein [Dysgonamonadaceae bacterium]